MFSKKSLGIIILAVLIAGVAFTFTRCYDDSEARVTIHLERNDLAFNKDIKQKRIIDRVLEFFSTPAYAVAVWDSSQSDLKLTVTSLAFDDKIYIIPVGTTEYSLLIPSGSTVIFTATCRPLAGIYDNWGGITVADLTPGEQSITLKMIPITALSYYDSGASWIELTWDTTILTKVTGYTIYRSTNANGPYYKIGIISGNTNSIYRDEDPELVSGITYYYKLSVNTADGTGLMSNYASGTELN